VIAREENKILAQIVWPTLGDAKYGYGKFTKNIYNIQID
jgi:hypothetical protein